MVWPSIPHRIRLKPEQVGGLGTATGLRRVARARLDRHFHHFRPCRSLAASIDW
jgi:hypothetical protein